MCGWIGKGSPAATPITASCFRNPAALIGVRRSVVNRQGEGGACSRCSRRSAQLGAADRVRAAPAVLEALDMQMAVRQVEHVPVTAPMILTPVIPRRPLR